MLITLEGLDGSGKTTVWESLREGRPDAVFTCEPTESWYGDSVTRSMRDDDADPLAELFLFTADRADHLSRVVRPALANGRVVISDRYTDSRFAYQAAALADSPLADELDPLEYIQSIRALHPPAGRDNLPRYRSRDGGRASGRDKQVRAGLVPRSSSRKLRTPDRGRPRAVRPGRCRPVAIGGRRDCRATRRRTDRRRAIVVLYDCDDAVCSPTAGREGRTPREPGRRAYRS